MLLFNPLPLILVLLPIVTTFSGIGLLAIWAGLSRRQWFLPTAVAVGVAALFLLIPAYDLVLVVLVQSLLTILCLRIVRRRQALALSHGEPTPQEPSLGLGQISLRDLLLLMVIVALISATVSPIPRDIWTGAVRLALSGSLLALATLAATWIGLGRTRWGWRLLAACLLFPTALVALFLSLVRSSGSPRPRWKKGAAALLALLILVPPTLALYAIRIPWSLPEPPPSDPKAYAAWLEAASGLANAEPSDTALETLKSYVTEHQSVLEQAHAAVQRSGCVPLQYNPGDLNRQLLNISQGRRLARAFDYEATVAHSEGRTEDALRSSLDEFRLAETMSRGGLIVNWMVKVAIDGIGSSRIMAIRHQLSASQYRQAIAMLQDLEAQSESFDVVLKRDQVWDARSNPWSQRLVEQVVGAFDPRMRPVFTDVVQRRHAQHNLLLTELALCAYRQEHGELPESLDALVPQYLPALLEDPFNGQGLIYHRTATDHQLYSVGKDGKDDGGQAASPDRLGPGDLLLEEAPPPASAKPAASEPAAP